MAFDSSKIVPVIGAIMEPFTETITVYDVGEDIVVASATAYRLRKVGHHIEPACSDIVQYVTDEDRKLGKEIREYYSSKLTIQALSGKLMRAFREDLYKYLISDVKTADSETYPMIYRLPDYYHEDMIFEKVSKLSVNGWKKSDLTLSKPSKERYEVTYLESFNRLTSQGKTRVFWFKRNIDDRLVRVSLDLRDPLLNLFVDYVNKHAIITLVGKYVCLSLDGQDYYKLDYWNLEI